MRLASHLASAAAVALVLTAASCSDDGESTADQAREAVDDAADKAGDAANDAGARALAESFRAGVKAKGGGQSLRTITLLNDVKGDLPGNPDVSGITDGNGDGQDDDGKVSVTVNDGHACVTVPATGDLVDVTGGSC